MLRVSFVICTISVICTLVQHGSAQNRIFGSEDIAAFRLVGGSNRCEGRLEIRPADTTLFGQACDITEDEIPSSCSFSSDDNCAPTGDNEAAVVCRQLGCDPTGAERVDPVQFGFSTTSVNVYRAFGYVCSGKENLVVDCRRTGTICSADDVRHVIAIRCGGECTGEPVEVPDVTNVPENNIISSDDIADFRLVNGANRCEGLLQIRPNIRSSTQFGQACDIDETNIPNSCSTRYSDNCEPTGDSEAMVICRQLGCDAEGAQRVDPFQFGFGAFAVNFYRAFGYVCSGRENSLIDCRRTGTACRGDDFRDVIAIRCGGVCSGDPPNPPGQMNVNVPSNRVIGSEDIADFRLVDGANRCQGRLEIRPNTSPSTEFGQACDYDGTEDHFRRSCRGSSCDPVGDNVAMVICRELGCDPVGAERADPFEFGFGATSINFYRALGYSCSGSESALTACRRVSTICVVDNYKHAIAIKCGGEGMVDGPTLGNNPTCEVIDEVVTTESLPTNTTSGCRVTSLIPTRVTVVEGRDTVTTGGGVTSSAVVTVTRAGRLVEVFSTGLLLALTLLVM